MPVMDGCEEIREIRQHLHLTLPIVAPTANELEEGRGEAMEAGSDRMLLSQLKCVQTCTF
jgi:CheY-like chemotaxis protein